MLILIDNYDSFSYNLYQMLGETEPEIKVFRNDEITPEEILSLHPDHLVISPGPGRPAEAGMIEELVRKLSGRLPILGVCLGHQAICEALGGRVTYAGRLMHGKSSEASIDQTAEIFAGLPNIISVARYHSLAAEAESLPDCLTVIAETAEKEIMAVAHKTHKTYGLQFHPESILTPCGKEILNNFLSVRN